ncbi:MAG: phosphoglycerate kinase [Gemmatimonadetes bacterium]|nr:phosphoglycerate kinase [Gemmatimonadota bacterium]
MKKTLQDLPPSVLSGAAVALRADFNVPLDRDAVADPSRIERTLPTIGHLVSHGARVVILSHLGRPGGRIRPQLTLEPIAGHLGSVIEGPVSFLPCSDGDPVRAAVAGMAPGSVMLFENTRFLAGETAGDPALADDWAGWADHFVMDAFGTAHRSHASTVGLPRAVKRNGGQAVAGSLVASEIEALGAVLQNPRRPYVAVVGGAKISGKIDAIQALLDRADALLIGGAMANTFFGALGLETGASLTEPEKWETARRLIAAAGPRLVLPVDCTVAAAIDPGLETHAVDRSEVGPTDAIGDLGPVSVELFGRYLAAAGTVVWNGPMGAFEVEAFARGTLGVATSAAVAADRGATVLIGGGDSAAAARMAGVATRITHISTGGGAALAFLAGKQLPGIEALSDLAPT